ncbi:uncharacterized protein LOC112690337 [Sipha flava]|uniref:Uncharacterized protein LOC112690337 n=1 Tax=Sipha flava TaxID=143950 RepID=A0A8B8GB32_9HEMI|nr:uncharacterized protein LOC112690337 [Sipha flava]
MMLDVTEVNLNLKNIVKNLKNKILNYYMSLTQTNISRINNAYKLMIAKSSEMPDTTEDLVELSKYVDECRYSTLSEMKALLRTVGDYIMFLFEYTEFKDEDINSSSQAFRWPQVIEHYLDLATSRVIQKKGVVEGQLKSKKNRI